MTRICHYCKLDLNVSRIDPGGKTYVCPVCERKRREKANENVLYRPGKPGYHRRLGADPERKEG